MNKMNRLSIFFITMPLLIWIGFLLIRQSIELTPNRAVAFITLGELVLLTPLLYLIKFEKFNISDLKLKKFQIKGCLTAIGLWIIVFIINAAYGLILQRFGVQPQVDITPLFKQLTPSMVFLLIVGGGIIAPIAEEVYFRGIIYNSLKAKFSVFNATLLSSLVFAAAHIYIPSLLPILLLSVILTILYEKYNSLYLPIILHITNNLFALISTYILSTTI